MTDEEKRPFPGLRPGRKKGKVQAHERALLTRLLPIGIALAVLGAVPKPPWWPLWLSIALAIVLVAAGIFFVARTLMDR